MAGGGSAEARKPQLLELVVGLEDTQVETCGMSLAVAESEAEGLKLKA
jgi:hypothetical protein